MKNILAAILLYAATLTGIAEAQQGVVRVIDLNGNMVAIPLVVRSGLGDIARGGNGVVMVDPIVLQMPYEFQQLVFTHEAAHAIGIGDETAADQFAGRMLRLAGFTSYQMQAACYSLLRFTNPFGDGMHLPAQVRARVIQAAYAD